MMKKQLLPDAESLDMACQNLRAFVRLSPEYESPKRRAERAWKRFAETGTLRHADSATKHHE